ncbi:Guanine nucleotide exchange factor lte1, variant 2 [Entomophthora muscae]|nr:Guanine nucleotide exchange factor lte1, variant 2 [Entomophthora muscae]
MSFRNGLRIFSSSDSLLKMEAMDSDSSPNSPVFSIFKNEAELENKVVANCKEKAHEILPEKSESVGVTETCQLEPISLKLSKTSSADSGARSRMGSLTYDSSISSIFEAPNTPLESHIGPFNCNVTPHIGWKGGELGPCKMTRRKSDSAQAARPFRFGQRCHSYHDKITQSEVEKAVRWQPETTEVIEDIGDSDDISLVTPTPERLLEALTSVVDESLVTDFFLTYRQFLSALELCRLLEKRFIWSLADQSSQRRVTRVRIFIVVRHWVSRYYPQDFLANQPVLLALGAFLDRAGNHPVVISSEPDLRIVRQMRRCLRCQGEIHGIASTNLVPPCTRRRSYLPAEFLLPDMLQLIPTALPSAAIDEDPETWSDDGVDEPIDQSLVFYGRRSHKGVLGFFKNLHQQARELALKARDRSSKKKTWNPQRHTILFTPNLSLPNLSSKGSQRDPSGFALHQHLFRRFAGAFILDYPPELIAQQLCIVEQRCLGDVGWLELVGWGQQPMENAPGIAAVVARFNLTCQWVASVVVSCRRLEDRVGVVERIIQVAHFCHRNRNFSTALQLVLGLQSGAVARLARTWDRVSPSEKQLLDALLPYAVPLRNWSSIRQAMEKVIEIAPSGLPTSLSSSLSLGMAYGQLNMPHSSPKGHCGAIPFLGLYLSDLVYNSELPSKINGRINFNKFRRIASIVRRVWFFQGLANAGYSFPPHPKLFPSCLFLPCLSSGEIHQLTLACEPGAHN